MTPQPKPDPVRAEREALEAHDDALDLAGVELPPAKAERLDRVLAFNGFAAVRKSVNAVVAAAGIVPAEAIDALVYFAGKRKAEPEVKGNSAVVDSIEQDVAVAEAVKRFVDDLDAIGKRFEARAEVRGGHGKPRPGGRPR